MTLFDRNRKRTETTARVPCQGSPPPARSGGWGEFEIDTLENEQRRVMSDLNLPQTLLTETEVAKQLRVSLAALRKWRVIKRDRQLLKVGSLVRYRQAT